MSSNIFFHLISLAIWLATFAFAVAANDEVDLLYASPTPYVANVPAPTPYRYLQKSGGGFRPSGSSYKKPSYYGGSSTYYGTRNSSGAECGSECFIILGIIFVVIIAVVIGWYWWKHREGSRNTNMNDVPNEQKWVKEEEHGIMTPCLPPGEYTGIYQQHGQHYSMDPFQIMYELAGATGQYSVRGNGNDTIGKFTLTGLWAGSRLALTKHYILGTGDPRENRGHQVHIRLEKIAGRNSMGGQYFVRTPQYSGDDDVEIWPVESPSEKAAYIEASKVETSEVIPTVVGGIIPSTPDQFVDAEQAKPFPSAPPLEETATPKASMMAGVYVPGQDNNNEETMGAGAAKYSVGPGMYAHPTSLYTPQAVAYHSSRMLQTLPSISSRKIVQETEVDVTVIKCSEQKLAIRLRGTGPEPKITGLPKEGVLAESDLEVGDKILSINGEAIIRGSADVVSKLNKATVGSVMVITVVRPVS